MFCYQCEQTARETGCTNFGVCGKDPETAALQDLLVYITEGISMYAYRAGQLGGICDEINEFAVEALFTTVTNVNFDAHCLRGIIEQAVIMRQKAKAMYEEACVRAGQEPEELAGAATWLPGATLSDLLLLAEKIGVEARKEQFGDTIAGLQGLLLYGLKGMAAYIDHAQILGKSDDTVYAFVHEALDYLTRDDCSVEDILAMCLKCGEVNLTVMGLLDAGHTERFGNPVPTPVRINPVKGKAILISGHDLVDLEALLKQTEGTGINIYTHGEMLPAHGYPALSKYSHLVGNYGGAWQDQAKEFDAFPGSILMTTNCIQKPRGSYMDRIFTCGLVAWPGVTHIADRDFKPVIDAALAAEGFSEDGEDKTILVGFGHNAVLAVADKVVDAVKNGDIRHFFLIGGCDGAKSGRNYYTEFAQVVPDDAVILTLACGKYRFNKLDFGDIGGIPRLLDIGQCNDAYSAIQIAIALAEAFETDVNSLPLSFILSWYEQKAVVILLTLLHLGIKNMRLGPTLPAFITPDVLQVLVDNYDLKPITTPAEDIAAILG